MFPCLHYTISVILTNSTIYDKIDLRWLAANFFLGEVVEMYLEAKTKDPNPKFPMSFGTILAGVNDGRYKNTAISPTAVDIKAIEKVLKKRFGDNTIQFTVIEVHSEMAVFLMGILEQDSVKFWVEDMLTNGETEEHTIRNPGYGQPP